MTLRVCRVAGCPTLSSASMCAKHRRDVETERGSSTARGYGVAHQALRAQWAPLVAAGTVRCWRCRQLIDPAVIWDLGHDDDDRTVTRGPEHAACNRAAPRHRA